MKKNSISLSFFFVSSLIIFIASVVCCSFIFTSAKNPVDAFTAGFNI